MGWGNCGTDKKGRPIGYVFDAICDHPGCNVKINRGLPYACGGMHGETEFGCDKYFCAEHLNNVVQDNDRTVDVCDDCKNELIESGEMKVCDQEGIIVPVGSYVFTFGSNHFDKDGKCLANSYVQIDGTYGGARDALVNARGDKFAFQYETTELAGVTRFNLKPVTLEQITLDGDQDGNEEEA